jgi:hypothetical protein
LHHQQIEHWRQSIRRQRYLLRHQTKSHMKHYLLCQQLMKATPKSPLKKKFAHYYQHHGYQEKKYQRQMRQKRLPLQRLRWL